MTRNIILMLCIVMALPAVAKKQKQELFPDGTPIPQWFSDTTKVSLSELGKQYVITDYGVKNDSTVIQTAQIQKVIDMAAANGGGVVIVPEGTFLTGALFFKPATHLHLLEGGRLKGSDRIADFPILSTRIEGETCDYFAALINADGVNGFSISGKGTIDGNGFHYWEEFWIRRKWNRACTNKDAQRPRLVYISNSDNVTVQDVKLMNSPFWTNHLYRCNYVRFLDCYIYAPTEGVKAPSSDAIDLDVCHNVLVRGCYMHVNDDAVVLKGGKGTFADQDPNNGPNSNIIVENCRYGRVHGCVTIGSESLHSMNLILRNCQVDHASRVLWLKMRPDTPQHYEYVRVENMKGMCNSFLVVRPWTQFFKPLERADMPLSQCNNITIKNINMDCDNFFDVGTSDKYALKDFSFENINITDKKNAFDPAMIEGTKVAKMVVNGVAVPNKK